MTVERSRRALLGSAAAAMAATSGCFDEVNTLVRGRRRPLRVRILTPTPDIDPFAPAIARRLGDALNRAGVRTSVRPASEAAFLRDVLVNGAFDLYVARHPVGSDPDVLREHYHSRFAEEVGWQNPTGLTSDALDDALDRQRHQTGEQRREMTLEALDRLGSLRPVAPVCLPRSLRAQRADADLSWGPFDVRDVLAYYGLSTSAAHVRVGVPSDGDSWNFNPLSAERGIRSVIADLLYDRVAVIHDGEVHPWLAADWSVDASDHDDRTVLEVTLRPNLTWHDGRRLTASDVLFTYRLLADTTLGGSSPPAPTVRHRGHSSLVEAVEVTGTRSVRFEVAASAAVAPTVLAVPVVPEHIWRERATRSRFGDSRLPVTRAITTRNEIPVGSGPYRHDRATRTQVDLERADHFIDRDPGGFAGQVTGSRPEQLTVHGLLSRELAREFLEEGVIDAATLPLSPAERDRLGNVPAIELTNTPSQAVYGVGFNTRRHPMGTPGFRRVVTRLLDRKHLVRTVFGGEATPVASMGAPLGTVPERLVWRDRDPPIEYLGTGGRIDADRAREAFRAAGFNYSDSGTLLVQR